MLSNNPVALVTGGTDGIGHAVALALAMEGYDVVIQHHEGASAAQITARECELASKAEDLETRTLLVEADTGSIEDRLRLLEMTDVFGERLDLLVCCDESGHEAEVDLLELTDEGIDEALATGVKGPLHLLQVAAEWMQELRTEGDLEEYTPTLILITPSPSGSPDAKNAVHSILAAARGALTSLFAVKLGASGIPVHEIRTGLINREMTVEMKEEIDHQIGHGMVPIRRWGQPEDVAEAVVSLASGGLPYSTGQVIHIDGGLHLRRS